ncbi:MAG: hypothetical protein K8S99_10315 [Planctomycetes bacterium]|nr:hypothetical protein [Planctomycetota bacterium]
MTPNRAPHRLPRFLCLLTAVLCLALAPAARAQFGQERLCHFFNFEERSEGNWEELPMNWYAIGRPAETSDPNFNRIPLHKDLTTRAGFPVHNMDVRFDNRQHTSGSQSLYLGLEGGSAGAFLGMGTIPVVPHSDYFIHANVRTTELKYASARVVAYFVNEQGGRIESSAVITPPISTSGQWTSVNLRLPGDFEDAAWLGIEVMLLQPAPSPDSPLGHHQINYQEARGGAWFDDIGVWQLPRATLTTQSPTNLIRFPDRPRMTVRVRDLTVRPITVELTLYDHTGRKVASERQSMGQGTPHAWNWTPPLPALGWYMTELYVRENESGKEKVIAHSIGSLLWLPRASGPGDTDTDRFVVTAENTRNDEMDMIPEVLDKTGIRSVVLSAWDRSTKVATMEDRLSRLDRLLNGMALHRQMLSLSISPPPDEMLHALDLDRDSPLPMAALPVEKWLPYLSPVLLRQGQAVTSWQMGSTSQADLFFMPNLKDLTARMRQEMQEYAPSPRITLPWRIDQAKRPDIHGAGYAIELPYSVKPRAIPEYLEEWLPAKDNEPVRLDLRLYPADQLTHERRLTDLAQRMVFAWGRHAPALALDRPWAVSRDSQLALMPDPALGVFSNVAALLAGRRCIGQMPIADGVECMIFDGPAGGMLVAWNRYASDDEAVIDMTLGLNPVATDMFGNSSEVPSKNNRHQWKLTSAPVFFTGIDPKLALFRSAFTVTPSAIESTQELHTRTITITNPWPVTLTGSFTITQPSTWRIQPKVHTFSISAQQSLQLPVQLTFPISEVAGAKRIIARFDFMADQHYVVDLSAPVDLGLKNVRSDATLALQYNKTSTKTDAVVTQLITNTGAEPISLYVFAQLLGYPRQERLVPSLKPGQSVVRRFRFEGADAAVREKGVRVGLRETGGPAVLNRVLHVEP